MEKQKTQPNSTDVKAYEVSTDDVGQSTKMRKRSIVNHAKTAEESSHKANSHIQLPEDESVEVTAGENIEMWRRSISQTMTEESSSGPNSMIQIPPGENIIGTVSAAVDRFFKASKEMDLTEAFCYLLLIIAVIVFLAVGVPKLKEMIKEMKEKKN